MRTHSPVLSPRDDIESMIESYPGHLRAANYSPKTISNYSVSIGPIIRFLRLSSEPLEIAEFERHHARTHIMRARRQLMD